MAIANSEHSDNPESLRKQVFNLLNKNHTLKPLEICKILSLTYRLHVGTVTQYKKQWKKEYRTRQALKCLSFHKAHGWVYALKVMDRVGAVGLGWEVTKARNGMIIWRDREQGLGRLEWFRTGRINVYVRKPATWGRVKQLLANAFTWTGLIVDIEVFELWFRTVQFHGAHVCLDTGERLPYARIDFLRDSLGVVAKIGDVSDPTCLELEFCYPKWAEHNELLFKQFSELLNDLFGSKNGVGLSRLKQDYSR